MKSLSLRLRPVGMLVCLWLSSFVVAAEEVEVLAEVAKLLASDGQESDHLGFSVSLDGDRMAVGAERDDESGSESGSVYIFERDTKGSWSQVGQLLALDGQEGDKFGYSVSLGGDRLAVGAYRDDENGVRSGSAYVFERDSDGTWLQVSKLLPPDGQENHFFGHSVSLDGDRMAIGATWDDDNGTRSGSAYLFERDATGTWFQVSKLLPLDGQEDDHFGYSVSLDGHGLAVGAYQDDDNGRRAGSAYVFERDAEGDWLHASKLLALDGERDDEFGLQVSLDDDRLAIGTSNARSVYVFEPDGEGNWIQASTLVEPAERGFGNSVSLDSDRLAVGALAGNDNGNYSGSAYVFERDANGAWFQASKLLPLDGQELDLFGHTVSLDGQRLAIGVHLDDDNGMDSGSVYVFEPVLVSPHLSISGTCPGEVQFTSTGTTPRSRFGSYGSPNQGLGEVESGPCAGAVLDLDAPTLLRLTDADFDAEGTLTRTIAESWCGTYMQVLDETTCLKSEAVQVPVAAQLSPKP